MIFQLNGKGLYIILGSFDMSAGFRVPVLGECAEGVNSGILGYNKLPGPFPNQFLLENYTCLVTRNLKIE